MADLLRVCQIRGQVLCYLTAAYLHEPCVGALLGRVAADHGQHACAALKLPHYIAKLDSRCRQVQTKLTYSCEAL